MATAKMQTQPRSQSQPNPAAVYAQAQDHNHNHGLLIESNIKHKHQPLNIKHQTEHCIQPHATCITKPTNEHRGLNLSLHHKPQATKPQRAMAVSLLKPATLGAWQLPVSVRHTH
jgi:hypothetical protein